MGPVVAAAVVVAVVGALVDALVVALVDALVDALEGVLEPNRAVGEGGEGAVGGGGTRKREWGR